MPSDRDLTDDPNRPCWLLRLTEFLRRGPAGRRATGPTAASQADDDDQARLCKNIVVMVAMRQNRTVTP